MSTQDATPAPEIATLILSASTRIADLEEEIKAMGEAYADWAAEAARLADLLWAQMQVNPGDLHALEVMHQELIEHLQKRR